jgi:hypothetical protein
MDSNSRLLESKGHFPTSARHLPGKKGAQGKNRAPDKEKGRREEVPAFSCYEPAGGGAGWSPREQREEVPPAGYSLMTAIIHLIVFKKMRPFAASSDHA